MNDHLGKSWMMMLMVAAIISLFPTPTSAQGYIPRSVEGFITADGDGVEGIMVEAYNQNSGQTTEAQDKTDDRGYYDIWADSSFVIERGDLIDVYFTYEGEEIRDQVNAEEGITRLDFEVDEVESSMGTFFILVLLFIISGIIFFLWKREVIKFGR